MPLSSHDILAAIDLGSNSFHMLIAKVDEFGGLEKIDSLRESVRLGEGLTKEKRLTSAIQQRGLKCLERFQERIAELPQGAVRIAGTNTLRKAKNAQEFIDKAQKILGHPIEIISGSEEARLIYMGVDHGHDTQEDKRLVIDIGGGSTELIVGEKSKLLITESLPLGCVSSSFDFFQGGTLTQERFTKATIHAKLHILPVFEPIIQANWLHVIGCSGTIKAIRRIVQKHHWCDTGITLSSLHTLRQEMIQAEHISNLSLKALRDTRRPVLAGGLAILIGLFEMFGLQHMEVSKQALREGLLYDLIEQLKQEEP